ncbi:MAG: transglycosylase SLT domain-containing protein [Myxococcota bacterium]
MTKARWSSSVVVCWLATGCAASAPSQIPPASSPEVRAEDTELSQALLQQLTVHVRADGTPVFARHCRNGPVDCEARVKVFAQLIEGAANDHGIDPFLLAALAVRESSLNPGAVGAQGEAGILQLHPRGAGRGMRYVEDEAHREACQARIDACQGPVVVRAAETLSASIDRCGSVRSALGRYASGRCRADLSHIDRVLETRDALKR